MKYPWLVACGCWMGCGFVMAQASPDAEMFPFVIPGLATPAAGSVVDLSSLNDQPAGRDGPLRVRDGRFIDGAGRRVRFLATNFTFGTCFPDHATADKLAARLASLGINCVRFHHMDNQAAPRGIWKAGTAKKDQLDPAQLDRLDYCIAALKRHGIYTNLNLHVSRNYWEGEDFPDGLADDRERQAKLPHYGKGLDKIDDRMIRMQRDYARALLGHVNPYTKTSYAKEPCVAIVEINNENTLLQLNVPALPDFYRDGILKKWNAWLVSRHGSTEKLLAAWGGREPLGSNLLPTECRIQGGTYLSVTRDAGGEIRVSLRQVPGTSWHAQLHWPALTLEEGKLYTLELTVRSEAPRRLPVSVRLNQDDWHNCGLSEEVEAGPQWKTVSFPFRANRVVPGALRFDIVAGGGPTGDFFLKNLSLRRGGSLGLKPGESLETGTVEAPARAADTPRGLEWTKFLAETERAYTDGMREFLKRDLGVEAAIIDTQASYGGVAGTWRESRNDFVDMHAYWQHPNFPGRPWDGANWRIPNTPMVDDKAGGNLLRLGTYRVAGLPFTVSEYDHPAPSHFAAEMFPVISSFAAVQDWDGLFQFDWGGTDSDSRRIAGYFSLQQHPGKLAFLPAAAWMFRRGDVTAASGSASLVIPEDQAEPLTTANLAPPELWKQAGLQGEQLLTHRLSLRFSAGGKRTADISRQGASAARWDAGAGVYTVDAPAAQVVVGRCTGKTTRLKGVDWQVVPNPLGFAVLTLNAVDGRSLAESRRLLLTAAGKVENTGMGWNEDHTSVGTQWGTAPTVCEGISAKISVGTQAKSGSVYILNGAGARVGTVETTVVDAGRLSFEIGPRYKTLWYEIVME